MDDEFHATKRLFFTGKGGVGKTSLASATALKLAASGKTTLIVSTDPASNLDEVFETTLGSEPTLIPGTGRLYGANLDPEAAAASYREKVVGPYRGVLPDAVVKGMEEQFSGACTTEIAAFDEFVRLMADPETASTFDHIVFDTAPTGHTLRLLSLPSAWSGYLNTTTAEASCLGPLAGLQEKRGQYQAALESLASPEETTVVLVARPEPASLKEAARTQEELASLGIRNLQLIVNGVYMPQGEEDEVSRAFAREARLGLESMPDSLKQIPLKIAPLMPQPAVGREALVRLLDPLPGPAIPPSDAVDLPPSLDIEALVADLAAAGSGVVMTMGKGGVGKTTVAVEVARRLAERGSSVLLTTTDPAGNVLEAAGGHLPGLEVARIDPVVELERYTKMVLEKASQAMDGDALALLKEDLRSPCTEEIAVFRAFAEAVDQGRERVVVIDTAPTGHTILLMDATESYHREVSRTQSDAPESVRQLLPRLRDPSFCRVILVALPEPTPVHEAASLQADLARAGIVPWAWVVNRSLRLAGSREAVLAAKAAQEAGPIREAGELAPRLVILPWRSQGARDSGRLGA